MRYSKLNLLCPEKLVIGISRFYVFNQLSGSPTLEQIENEVDNYGISWMLCPLMTVWDTFIATTTEEIKARQPDCPCRSVHEQALLLAMHGLSNGDPWMAHASLSAVVPESAVRLILPELRKIIGRLACEQTVVMGGGVATPQPESDYPAEQRQLH